MSTMWAALFFWISMVLASGYLFTQATDPWNFLGGVIVLIAVSLGFIWAIEAA